MSAGKGAIVVIENQASQTRAPVLAREADTTTVRRIWIPPGARRTPLVFVEIERMGWRLTFAVARLKRGALEVRPPREPDGTGDGLWMPARERERISAAILAAVEADPEARAALRRGGWV